MVKLINYKEMIKCTYIILRNRPNNVFYVTNYVINIKNKFQNNITSVIEKVLLTLLLVKPKYVTYSTLVLLVEIFFRHVFQLN